MNRRPLRLTWVAITNTMALLAIASDLRDCVTIQRLLSAPAAFDLVAAVLHCGKIQLAFGAVLITGLVLEFAKSRWAGIVNVGAFLVMSISLAVGIATTKGLGPEHLEAAWLILGASLVATLGSLFLYTRPSKMARMTQAHGSRELEAENQSPE